MRSATLAIAVLFVAVQCSHSAAAQETRITNDFAVSLIKQYLRENTPDNVKKINSVAIKPKHHNQLQLTADVDVKYQKITLPGVKISIDAELRQSNGIEIRFQRVKLSFLGALGGPFLGKAEKKIERLLQDDLGPIELKNVPFHIRILKDGDFLVIVGKRVELEEMILWDDFETPFDKRIAAAMLKEDQAEVERLVAEREKWRKETKNGTINEP